MCFFLTIMFLKCVLCFFLDFHSIVRTGIVERIVIERLNLKFNLCTPLQHFVSRELLFRQNKASKTEHGWNYCGVKPAKLLFCAQHFYVPPPPKKRK